MQLWHPFLVITWTVRTINESRLACGSNKRTDCSTSHWFVLGITLQEVSTNTMHDVQVRFLIHLSPAIVGVIGS